MIITDRFVFVHFPKTGGTFVEEVLERIHRARGDRIVEWRVGEKPPDWKGYVKLLHPKGALYVQHGMVSQIPPEFRDRPVLTVLRNPYDRIVSQFTFKWWIQNPPDEARVREMRLRYPNYPELTLEEFIRHANTFPKLEANQLLPPEDRLGRQTFQFTKYFFTDPSRFARIDTDYFRERRYRKDVDPRLRPVFQDDLNRQLRDFLLGMGYGEAETAFIRDLGRVYPGGSTLHVSLKWEQFYTPELKAEVRHRERMLFDLYPQWDV